MPLLSLGGLTACANKIDRFTVDRVVARAADVGDTGKVCALGASLVHPLASLSKNRPERALTIAEGVSAVCDEAEAWEAELGMERARRNEAALGEGRAAEITDASLRAARAHARAAARFERAFQAVQAEYGPMGSDCPKIAEKDEFVYVFGMVSGTLALLHDRAAGGPNDIPMDRLAVIARGSECIDDARWWSLPSALRGSAWATVPGSGPEGTDPWQILADAAARGEGSGVRVARAMQVLIAANSGRDDLMGPALAAHAASMAATAPSADWALLDTYAYEVSLHQSDLVWTRERGHRTERFGELPQEEAPQGPSGPDPFGEADPFGAPAPEPGETEPAPPNPG